MSLREECFITPLSYTAHIPARHPAAKPYHMAPAFHVKVLVHNTHTHTFSHQAVLSPGSRLADARCWCQWELRGLAAVDVYRLRWPPCCRGSLFAVSWLGLFGGRGGVFINELGRTLFSLCRSCLASAAVSSVCA